MRRQPCAVFLMLYEKKSKHIFLPLLFKDSSLKKKQKYKTVFFYQFYVKEICLYCALNIKLVLTLQQPPLGWMPKYFVNSI